MRPPALNSGQPGETVNRWPRSPLEVTMWIRSHLSSAHAIAIVALFVALGGTSVAAITLSKNSVGAKQIKTNAVRATEIKPRSRHIRGSKRRAIRRGLRPGQLPAGPKGDKGDKGDTGDTGAFGTVTAQFEQAPADLANGANMSYSVFCPAGEQAIGGGGRGDDTLSEETNVTTSRPRSVRGTRSHRSTEARSPGGASPWSTRPAALPPASARRSGWPASPPHERVSRSPAGPRPLVLATTANAQ